MREMKDDELQRLIFESHHTDDVADEDGDLYKMLKGALEATPRVDLPEDFAHLVTKKAVRRKRLHHLFRSVTLYFASAAFLTILGGLALFFLAKDVFNFLLENIQTYKYPVVFAVMVIVLIQLMDEFLVYQKTLRSER